MPVTSMFYLHGLKLAGGTNLTQITDSSSGLSNEILRGMSAGYQHPMFRGILAQTPNFEFTTQQLATLLAAVTMNGLAVSGNSDLLMRAGVNNDSRDAIGTTSHQRLRTTGGMLYWSSVSARVRQVAEASCRFIPTYDGTNPIIAPTGSVAIDVSPAAGEQFTLGPVSINGTFVPGLQSWSLGINPQIHREWASGETWPSWCGVQETDPVLTLNVLRNESWTERGVLGQAISSLTFFLKRVTPDGPVYGDGQSQHLKFTAQNGLTVIEATRAGGNNRSETTLLIPLRTSDPTVDPVAVTTGQQIAA